MLVREHPALTLLALAVERLAVSDVSAKAPALAVAPSEASLVTAGDGRVAVCVQTEIACADGCNHSAKQKAVTIIHEVTLLKWFLLLMLVYVTSLLVFNLRK